MARQRIINHGVIPQPQRGAIRFYNDSTDEIPPYYPLVLNQASIDPNSNPFDVGNGVMLQSPVLAAGHGSSLTGLPFVNGAASVGPQSYGFGTLSHPMPLAVDPDSFPIWDGSPNNPPTLGDVNDYQNSGQDNFPPLGFSGLGSGGNFWNPASFSPQIPCWMALCWDQEPDGTLATDRVLAVPWSVRDFPYAGSNQIAINDPISTSPIEILGPITVLGSGLYQLFLTCTVAIDVPGAAVTLQINYTQGPNSPGFVSGLGAVVPGSWGSVYRQSPKFTVGNGGGSGGGDDDTVNFVTTGAEAVTLVTSGFAFQGDTWTLTAVASEDCDPTIVGSLTYNRIGTSASNDSSVSAFAGSGGWSGPYWNGWWGGGFGWGWGWGWGPGGLSASWW